MPRFATFMAAITLALVLRDGRKRATLRTRGADEQPRALTAPSEEGDAAAQRVGHQQGLLFTTTPEEEPLSSSRWRPYEADAPEIRESGL